MSIDLLNDLKATIRKNGIAELYAIAETKEIHLDAFRAGKSAKRNGGSVKKINASKVLAAQTWDEIFAAKKAAETPANKATKASKGDKGDPADDGGNA